MKELEDPETVMLIDQLCDRLDLVAIIILGITREHRLLAGGCSKGEHIYLNISRKKLMMYMRKALNHTVNRILKFRC